MNITFREATPDDSEIIAALVISLTTEICELTNTQYFDINLNDTVKRCYELINNGHYAAIIGESDNEHIAVVTMSETYALYAGGKIGVIQECYVAPTFRSTGIGSTLIEQVQMYAKKQKWASIELCTPPLPEFQQAVNFYQKHGLITVGGRKMRQTLL